MNSIISILCIVLALACLFYSIHLSVIYHRFNEGIKDWAKSIDSNTYVAIQRSARQILKELDEKITEQNALKRLDEEVQSDDV